MISFAAYKLEDGNWDTTRYYTFSYIVKFPDGLTTTSMQTTTTTSTTSTMSPVTSTIATTTSTTSSTTTTLKPITTTTVATTTSTMSSSTTTSSTTTSSTTSTTTTTLKPVLDCPSGATCYYVSSSSGNDANSGLSPSTPWKSLEKVSSTSFKPGNYVLFKRGDSWYGSITVTNSGIAGSPIIYGAYGVGDKPLISGFTTISGWTNEGNGIYSKSISVQSPVNLVTVDGVNTPMGRWPNSGWLTYESSVGTATRDTTVTTPWSITDNQLTDNLDWTGAELVLRVIRWSLDRVPITDHSGSTLTFTPRTRIWAPTNGFGYFIQNDIRTLDSLGEWYYDKTNSKFYMYFGDVNPSTKVVRVTTIDTLFTISRPYIIVDGLSFEGANIYGLNSGGRYFTSVKNSNFNFMGMTGVRGAFGSGTAPRFVVEGNEFSDCNDKGITVYAVEGSSLIRDNTVRDIGLLLGLGLGNDGTGDGISVYSLNGIVEYNRVDNVGHNGISIRTYGNVTVRNNYITNIGFSRYDAGAIYTWSIDDGTTNYIYDNIVVGSKHTSEGIGGWTNLGLIGIYIDELNRNYKIYNNTAAEMDSGGISYSHSTDGLIKDNLCYDNGVQFRMRYTGTESAEGYSIGGMQIMNNQFVSKTANQLAFSYRDDRGSFNLFGTSDNNYYARPISDDKVIETVVKYTPTLRSLSEWQALSGQDPNSKKSPVQISNADDILFEYNPTNTQRTVTLSGNYVDVTGKAYFGSVKLAPYRSIVLIKV